VWSRLPIDLDPYGQVFLSDSSHPKGLPDAGEPSGVSRHGHLIGPPLQPRTSSGGLAVQRSADICAANSDIDTVDGPFAPVRAFNNHVGNSGVSNK
jgi:hypothetical protein